MNEQHVPRTAEQYLGDAVYASFDGWQIQLRTGDGNNQVIYLEPSVLNALFEYARRVMGDPQQDAHVPGAHT